MIVLYVNDTPVDLPNGFIFAYTIQKVEVGDLSTRKINFTNTVKLKWTPTNLVLFGFALNEKSDSTVPYYKQSCKLVDNGIEIINGVCWTTSADQTGVSITLFENLLDIFDYIAGRKLIDLNYVAPSAWTAAGIDTARLATTQVMSAVLNWGKAGAIYQFNYFLPSFFYGEMIQAILQSTGLTLSGDILTDAKFTDLIVPYGKDTWEYPESFGAPYRFKVSVDAGYNQIINTATSYNVLWDKQSGEGVFGNFYQGSAQIYDPITGIATLPEIGYSGDWLNVTLECAFGFDINSWPVLGDSFNIEFVVVHNGTPTAYSTASINDGTYPVGTGYVITLTAHTEMMSSGDTFYVRLTNATSNGIDINVNPYIAFFPDSQIAFTMSTPVTPDRTSVVWNQLMPDVLQSYVLKDFTSRFGIIYKQVGNTLYLKTLQEILADRSGAIDWTAKRVNKGNDAIKFSDSAYAIKNYFKHTDQVSDENLGAGLFELSTDLLSDSKTIFTSVFGNAITASYSSGQKALIPVYGATSTGIETFENTPELRILTLRAKETAEGSITFNGIARSDYRVGYFVDPTQAKDTGFQYFVDQQYGVFSDALQKAKTVTHYYALTALDIANYDPHKLIYDDGAYYIVNKIVDYVSGRITKVELFKV